MRAEQGPTTPPSATRKKVLNLTDQDELSRLRKDVEHLRMECNILQDALRVKKAAVFFGKEL